MPLPRSRLPLRLPPLPTVKVSLLLLRVMFSTPVTPPPMAVTEVSALVPFKVALTALP